MFKLRKYQKESTDNLLEFIATKTGNPLVCLPTGSGKTICIADIATRLVGSGKKVLILSHVKEILEQDHAAIKAYSGIDAAIYSAMLNRKEIGNLTIGGIQSVFRKSKLFVDFDYVIVDEAHLIPFNSDTMYRRFLKGIPSIMCIGFTATPFRLGRGYIYGTDQDHLFTDLVCDWTNLEKFNRLIDDGFLCKMTTKRTKLEMDMTGINLMAGDFNEKQMSKKFDKIAITNKAIAEIIAAGKERNHWMVFAIDIDHADHIAHYLIRSGIKTAVVHSRMEEYGFDRDEVIRRAKSGEYKCVVNVNILTTGYDNPAVDLIAILRPTQSQVLHVQMIGRGSRVLKGKKDCLVLDFAGNTERIGAINDIKVREKRKKGDKEGEPIMKVCPKCNSIVFPAVRICPDCQHPFEFEHGLKKTAGDADVVSTTRADYQLVDSIKYLKHVKDGSPNSVKVEYKCGSRTYSEWICVEHQGFAKKKADHWVKFRGGKQCDTADELIAQSSSLAIPTSIKVQKRGLYSIIQDAIF